MNQVLWTAISVILGLTISSIAVILAYRPNKRYTKQKDHPIIKQALNEYQEAIDAGAVRPLTMKEREFIRKHGVAAFMGRECDSQKEGTE